MTYDGTRLLVLLPSATDRPVRTRIEETAVIDAPLARTWDIVRSFGAGELWLPGVVGCEIEGETEATAIGAVRRLTLADGRKTREQLVGLSDVRCTLELTILESAMPARNYIATFQLLPISDGDQCWISWSAEFDADVDDVAALSDRLRHQIYRAGFDGLRRALSS